MSWNLFKGNQPDEPTLRSQAFYPHGTVVLFKNQKLPEVRNIRIAFEGVEIVCNYIPTDPVQREALKSIQQKEWITDLKVVFPSGARSLTVSGEASGEAACPAGSDVVATLRLLIVGFAEYPDSTQEPAPEHGQ